MSFFVYVCLQGCLSLCSDLFRSLLSYFVMYVSRNAVLSLGSSFMHPANRSFVRSLFMLLFMYGFFRYFVRSLFLSFVSYFAYSLFVLYLFREFILVLCRWFVSPFVFSFVMSVCM